MNYEISKTRKYKKDIGKMENMEYDPEKDSNWISPDGDCLSMP